MNGSTELAEVLALPNLSPTFARRPPDYGAAGSTFAKATARQAFSPLTDHIRPRLARHTSAGQRITESIFIYAQYQYDNADQSRTTGAANTGPTTS